MLSTNWTSSDEDSLSDLQASLQVSWILNTTFLVFFMQAGFSMLEAGSVRVKNTKNILLKNLIDTAVGGICFWSLGYAFAFGDGNKFIGTKCFFMYHCDSQYAKFVFQWAFSATAATIVSGPLAERTQFSSYLLHSLFVTTFLYPSVAHWVWNENGWLFNLGYIDIAGASAVHIVGGCLGFWGSLIAGPRIGRFGGTDQVSLLGHSASLSILGAFILWYGWYGFNCGSVSHLVTDLDKVASRVAVNTTLCTCMSGVSAMTAEKILSGAYITEKTINGILSGLVASTSGCAVNDPWSFLIIGGGSGVLYVGFSRAMVYFKIDDPLDAVSVHLGSGVWSILSTAAFAESEFVTQVFKNDHGNSGFLFGGGFKLLGIQTLGVLAVVGWSSCFGLCFFGILNRLQLLRVSYDAELAGLDNTKHGGPAYPEFTL